MGLLYSYIVTKVFFGNGVIERESFSKVGCVS